jgi:CcmD family protein
MLSLLIAYLAAWLGLLGYVLRLAAQQRRLQETVAAWQRREDALETPTETPASKAA